MEDHARMRHLLTLATLLGWFVCSGATCIRRPRLVSYPPPPSVLPAQPQLGDVISAINRTDSIQQLSTNSASIRVINQTLPRLSATVHVQRDKDFRLLASVPMVLGSGLDIGSNGEVFWMEFPDGMTRTMYFARHDLFRNQVNRAIVPIDPAWLIDAMGLLHLESTEVIAGPVVRPDGLLELRSWMPDRVHQRVCYVDAAGGFVVRQMVNRPLAGGGEVTVAESQLAKHRFDEVSGTVLPHEITLRLIPAGAPEMQLQIDVGDYVVNQLLSGDPDLFVMPQTASQIQDLTRLTVTPPTTVGATT